ncbi:MAG TPA: hypothetical protein VGB57_09600 [Allosphingosinicella sp.]|jgi:hypothetical protein
MAVTSIYRDTNVTRLSLGKSLDGQFKMIIHNDAWSAEENKLYELYLLVDDKLFSGRGLGLSGGTLLLNLKPEVMQAIIKGARLAPALKIDDDNERVLEAMKLTGSAGAMARVATCVAAAAEANRRAERFPSDPFKR